MNELTSTQIYEILRNIDNYTTKELQAHYKKIVQISNFGADKSNSETKNFLKVMIKHTLKMNGYEYDVNKDMELLERAHNLHHKLNTKCYYGVECKISRSVLISECKYFGITGYTKYKKNDLVNYMLNEISHYAGLYSEIKEQQEEEEEEKREKEIMEQFNKEKDFDDQVEEEEEEEKKEEDEEEEEEEEEEEKEEEKKKVKKEFYLPIGVFKNILDFCGEPLPPDIITNREPRRPDSMGLDEFREWCNKPITKEDLEEERGYKITKYTYTREQGKIKRKDDYRWACSMCKTRDIYTGQRYSVCGRCEDYYHQQKWRMRFGRHKNERWCNLDDNYKKWIIENMRGNEKLVDFCKHTLKCKNRVIKIKNFITGNVKKEGNKYLYIKSEDSDDDYEW